MSFRSRVGKLASETAVYGISSVVGRLVTFLLVPFYTQFFAPEVYGVVILVYTAFVFLNIVYTYGMESAYLKYASGEDGRRRKQETFSIATWSLLGTSLVISTLVLLLRGPAATVIGIEDQWIHLLYYAVAILTLDTLTVVPFAELRLSSRPVVFAVIKIANILTNVGLNVLFIVGFGWGIESIFIANLASSTVSILLLLPQFVQMLRLRFSPVFWKEMMRFGLPFLPGGLGYALTDRVNLFFLARMDRESVTRLYGDGIDLSSLASRADEIAAGLATAGAGAATAAADAIYGQYIAGVFGTVWKLGIFMMLLVQMFRYAWQPFFLQHAGDEDARPLFSKVFTLFTAGALFVLLAVSFFAEELVALPLPGGRTLIERSYWLGLPIVPIALLAYFFQGWYYNFSAGAYIQKKTIYFVHCTVAGGVVAVLLNAMFVPMYGMVAAAWATSIAYGVMALMLGVIMYRVYPLPYEWRRLAITVCLATGLFAAWWLVDAMQTTVIEAVMLVAFAVALAVTGIIPVSAFSRRRGQPK